MTTFTRRDSRINRSGTHLMFRLPTLETDAVVAAFGAPDPGYDDPENGYEREYVFTDDATGSPVTLYDRWGTWRVGALDPDVADAFVAWAKTLPGMNPAAWSVNYN